MRSYYSLSILLIAALIAALWVAWAPAADYNSRFVRNYPPGFNGMWYKAGRFFDPPPTGKSGDEQYRWDKYMSRVVGVTYPFYPTPFDWDYGTGRTFNLPDYNTNDWP